MYSDAYNERVRDTQEIHASLTATMVNFCQQPSKNPVRMTVRKLIGDRKGRKDAASFSSVEEMKAYVADLKAKGRNNNRW